MEDLAFKIVAAVVAAAVSGAVGFVWSRLLAHEARIIRVETMLDVKIANIEKELKEIKETLKEMRRA
jgi:hypothetical protein